MEGRQNQKLITGPQQTLFMEQPTIAKIYPPNSVRKRLEVKFKNKMHEELRLSSSVSYVGNKKIPLLRIYRYKESFAFNFVRDFLKRFNADSNDYVFDPFSGLGTTMFTSMLSGIPSIGIDKLPVAYFISKTLPLFLFLRENEVKEMWESIKPRIEKSEPANVAMDVPIMQVAFSEKNLLF